MMQRVLAKLVRKRHATISMAVKNLTPPPWVSELLGKSNASADGVTRIDGEHLSLVTVRLKDAADLAPAELEQQTFEAYATIAKQLVQHPKRRAVRFWNHIPFITEPADTGRDNYMVFNAGRFRAFSQWHGSPAQFDHDVATASATGHRGRDLVIHCLAADALGGPINNPRQVAPYHYSQRFGPLPPCFARATRLAHFPGMLLIGGTASVRGEDSVHMDDLPAQCAETLLNLAALIGTAIGSKPGSAINQSRMLSTFRELRIYYPNLANGPEIESLVRAAFPKLTRLEMFPADLCRAELLVEIEGLADLNLSDRGR